LSLFLFSSLLCIQHEVHHVDRSCWDLLPGKHVKFAIKMRNTYANGVIFFVATNERNISKFSTCMVARKVEGKSGIVEVEDFSDCQIIKNSYTRAPNGSKDAHRVGSQYAAKRH
jgi:hypothetical protein